MARELLQVKSRLNHDTESQQINEQQNDTKRAIHLRKKTKSMKLID